MKYLRQLRCKRYSVHKLPEVAPPKIEKRDFACLISNFRNVSLHTNPLQSFIVKYNKNETCGNLLLNKNLKGKACRSYDGEVIPFLKLPPPPPPPPPKFMRDVKGKRSINIYNIAVNQIMLTAANSRSRRVNCHINCWLDRVQQ